MQSSFKISKNLSTLLRVMEKVMGFAAIGRVIIHLSFRSRIDPESIPVETLLKIRNQKSAFKGKFGAVL